MDDVATRAPIDASRLEADRRNGEPAAAPPLADDMVQPTDPARWAERAVRSLRSGRCTAAVAESLTSGEVAAALGRARGSGRVFAGGVVTYSRAAKSDVLGIDARHVVDAGTAQEMAVRTRDLFGSDLAVALTGVAGPDRQDGVEVGTVYVGWATADAAGAERHRFAGSPDDVCRQATCVALRRLGGLAGPARRFR